MMATGIIRRIDDLGRLVVPRAIRQRYGIVEGDAFEIFCDKDGGITFRKYDFDAPVETALHQLKNAVKSVEGASYSSEFLQTIYELEARLKLEKENKKND